MDIGYYKINSGKIKNIHYYKSFITINDIVMHRHI